VKRAL